MTTLNEIISNHLKGKLIIVYEYDALFLKQNERRISHYYLTETDEHRVTSYQQKDYWADLNIKKHMASIVNVEGSFMDYEGTHISMTVDVNGKKERISFHMEDEIELI